MIKVGHYDIVLIFTKMTRPCSNPQITLDGLQKNVHIGLSLKYFQWNHKVLHLRIVSEVTDFRYLVFASGDSG